MKSKQIGYLLIAIIALGVLGLAGRLISTEIDEPVLTGLQTLKEDVVDRLVFSSTEGEATLLKQDDGWFIGEYPAFDARMMVMWDTASRFEGADLISSNPENHWLMGATRQHGTTVQFWSGDTLREELFVGDHFAGSIGMRQLSAWSPSVRLCYVRNPPSNDVFGLTCVFPDNFIANADEWKDPVIAEIPREDVQFFSYEFANEKFEVQPVDQVDWAVVSDDGVELARETVMNGIFFSIQRLMATSFPTDEEMETIDFSNPDLSIGIATKPGSETPSIRLLFLDAGDANFFVKEASKSYAYMVDSDPIFDLLSSRERFTTEPTFDPIPPVPGETPATP